MEIYSVKFWVRLTLLITTSFIVLSYIFKPSDNQCRMTFMMEPPKFISIPIDEVIHREPRYHKHYKLYMYSEFGFPLESDIRRDLKDSMPVLFIPGNAGSYQQVRSLASTCIRRHLQSLDASKFIFYTIDFKAQLSGISGHMINEQIHFAKSALQQISSMHSTDTHGVIVIGHSVGGFIAKALLARTNINKPLVPILINLASPLTRSFLNFDDEIKKLYDSANEFWSKRTNDSQTLAISISGGKSDRLVPMHLSLDPHYDISLTTSSMKDVWLTTDHVCITWCRELMHKLANLLSALMDKKHTRVIDDRDQALKLLADHLLTDGDNIVNIEDFDVVKGQRLITATDIRILTHSFEAKRNLLIDNSVILNLTQISRNNIFIWLEHIDNIKETGLYACRNIQIDQKHLLCDGRVDILSKAKTIPSRAFEPKRMSMSIKNVIQLFRYIVIDFSSSKNQFKVPESIVIDSIDDIKIQRITLPHLTQYIFKRIFSPSSLIHDIASPHRAAVVHSKIELMNLDRSDQFYTAIIESQDCRTNNMSLETVVSLMHDTYLSESFHPDKNTFDITVKLASSKTIIKRQEYQSKHEKTYLDLYLNGNCGYHVRLEFDWWSFIESVIQNQPSQILICSIYVAYASVVTTTLKLIRTLTKKDSDTNNALYWPIWLSGFILSFMITELIWLPIEHTTEKINIFVAVLFLSSGLMVLIGHVFSRLTDLTFTFNNWQTCLRRKIIRYGAPIENGHSHPKENNGKSERINNCRSIGSRHDFLLVSMTAIGSLILSEGLVKVCILLIILKLELKLAILKSENKEDNLKACYRTGKNSFGQIYDSIHYMLLSIASLCTLSLITSTPAILLKINSIEYRSIGLIFIAPDKNLVISIISLILVKLFSTQLEIILLSDGDKGQLVQEYHHHLIAFLPKNSHVLMMIILPLITQNICNTSSLEALTLLWVARRMLEVTQRKCIKID